MEILRTLFMFFVNNVADIIKFCDFWALLYFSLVHMPIMLSDKGGLMLSVIVKIKIVLYASIFERCLIFNVKNPSSIYHF
jgi:hypothetical protein